MLTWRSRRPFRWQKWALFGVLGGLIPLISFVVWSVSLPPDRVAAGVSVDGYDLSGLSQAMAEAKLAEALPPLPDRPVTVVFENMVWHTSTAQLHESSNQDISLSQAWSVGRTGPWSQQLQERWSARWFGRDIPHTWTFAHQDVESFAASISASLSTPGKKPSASVRGNSISVDPGERGLAVLTSELQEKLQTKAGQAGEISVDVPVEITVTPLSPDGVLATQARAEKLKNIEFEILTDESERPVTVPTSQVFTWLEWPDGFNEASMSADLQTLAENWDRPAQSAEFELSADGKKVTTFVPHRLGRKSNTEALAADVKNAINRMSNETEASPQPTVLTAQFAEEAPEKSLADLNTLGITERIGVATSEYAGSIPNRVFNVQLTAERVHGALVQPGEEFSFNESVGEISAQTGYKTAYVIMNGRTQLGDGGGVCQVSTTIFRSVLDAGLPVTAWKAHSYRVGYYEQNSEPGFDATVYAPTTDFRFKNDTANSIVIAAYPDSENRFLTVEFWGTSDGRQSQVSDYKIWNQRPAPAPLFVDDPTLPAGTRQQIDWATPGANTSFHYQVVNESGEVMHERDFVSVFRPWQAVYLVGTGN